MESTSEPYYHIKTTQNVHAAPGSVNKDLFLPGLSKSMPVA